MINEADIICQRIEMGFPKPGDWIRLTSEIAIGRGPTLYEIHPTLLKITAIKKKEK